MNPLSPKIRYLIGGGIDYAISTGAAAIYWYLFDDHLAAALNLPGLSHLPVWMVIGMFGALRIATDTSSAPKEVE